MNRDKLLRFKPILKQTIWGGSRIAEFKHIANPPEQVGESWEISGVKGSETVVNSGGMYDGKSLCELVKELKGDLVGQDNYNRFGNYFPLLIKFIDASKDLSIQVHPSDEQARRKGLERGKTEMWYIMDSAPTAKLTCGLKEAITPEDYKRMVADDTICNAISEHPVKEGDCFFIPAGRIHSIGAGCFLAEIQETSDVTYRIYDFKRKDKNGNYRQLHTKEAAEAIDYSIEDNYRTAYKAEKDCPVPLISCPHFTVALYELTESMTLDYSELDSFVILICTKGTGTITDEDGNATPFAAGDTVLLPAWDNQVTVEGALTFLEAYV